MVKCQKNIACVESGCIFLESANLGQVKEEFTTWAVLKDKEKLAVTLECIVHLDNKWVTDVFL